MVFALDLTSLGSGISCMLFTFILQRKQKCRFIVGEVDERFTLLQEELGWNLWGISAESSSRVWENFTFLGGYSRTNLG